jgi:hypothetical protein
MVIELALWGVPQSRRRGYATVLVHHAIRHMPLPSRLASNVPRLVSRSSAAITQIIAPALAVTLKAAGRQVAHPPVLTRPHPGAGDKAPVRLPYAARTQRRPGGADNLVVLIRTLRGPPPDPFGPVFGV